MSKIFHKKIYLIKDRCKCLSICREESELSFQKCPRKARTHGSYCSLHEITDKYSRAISLKSGRCCICMADYGGLKFSCTHIMCLNCLKNLIDSSQKYVYCPVCRRRILGLPPKKMGNSS